MLVREGLCGCPHLSTPLGKSPSPSICHDLNQPLGLKFQSDNTLRPFSQSSSPKALKDPGPAVGLLDCVSATGGRGATDPNADNKTEYPQCFRVLIFHLGGSDSAHSVLHRCPIGPLQLFIVFSTLQQSQNG